jgi:hypothetical protein
MSHRGMAYVPYKSHTCPMCKRADTPWQKIGFRVQGLGCRVYKGCRVLGFMVYGLGFRVQGLGSRV